MEDTPKQTTELEEFDWANAPREKKPTIETPPVCDLDDEECLSCGS